MNETNNQVFRSISNNYFFETGSKQSIIEKIEHYEKTYCDYLIRFNSYSNMINIYLDSSKHYYELSINEFFDTFQKNETKKLTELKKYTRILKDELRKLDAYKNLINTESLEKGTSLLEEIKNNCNTMIAEYECVLVKSEPVPLEKYIKNKIEWLKDYENKTSNEITITIIGRRGVGKSSFINSIRNLKSYEYDENDKNCIVANTDEIECTMSIKYFPFTNYNAEHVNHKIYLLDFPGFGTDNFPLDDYAKMLDNINSDVLIYLFKNNLEENDLELISSLPKRLPLFLVRNKSDIEFENYVRPFISNKKFLKLNESELEKCMEDHWETFRLKLTNSLMYNSGNKLKQKIYLISCISSLSTYFDFKELIEEILKSLDQTKSKTLLDSLKTRFAHAKARIGLKSLFFF